MRGPTAQQIPTNAAIRKNARAPMSIRKRHAGSGRPVPARHASSATTQSSGFFIFIAISLSNTEVVPKSNLFKPVASYQNRDGCQPRTHPKYEVTLVAKGRLCLKLSSISSTATTTIRNSWLVLTKLPVPTRLYNSLFLKSMAQTSRPQTQPQLSRLAVRSRRSPPTAVVMLRGVPLVPLVATLS